MKNRLLTLVFIFAALVSTYGQSLQIENAYGNYYDPLQDALAISCDIRNIGNTTEDILVKSSVQYVPSGTINFLCWAQCYGPAVTLAPAPLTADPNGVIDQFHGYYRNYGVLEEATIQYIFFLENNPNDSIVLNAVFNPATVGINNAKAPALFSASPNPANEQFKITYANLSDSNNAVLEVYNMLGSKVYNTSLNATSGQVEIPSNNFKSGLYLYTIRQDGKSTFTGKIVVKH
jgi:hypothetical protein